MPHANCIRDDKEGRINYKLTGKDVCGSQYVCCVCVHKSLCVHALNQIFIGELEKIKAVCH